MIMDRDPISPGISCTIILVQTKGYVKYIVVNTPNIPNAKNNVQGKFIKSINKDII